MESYGIRLPMETDYPGKVGFCASEREHVRQAVAMIIRTRPGTRPLLPGFGCRLHELLFRPVSAAFCGQAMFFVEEALRLWETRIEGVEVAAQSWGGQEGQEPYALRVTVRYRIKGENGGDPETLSFSFRDGIALRIGPGEMNP